MSEEPVRRRSVDAERKQLLLYSTSHKRHYSQQDAPLTDIVVATSTNLPSFTRAAVISSNGLVGQLVGHCTYVQTPLQPPTPPSLSPHHNHLNHQPVQSRASILRYLEDLKMVELLAAVTRFLLTKLVVAVMLEQRRQGDTCRAVRCRFFLSLLCISWVSVLGLTLFSKFSGRIQSCPTGKFICCVTC